MIGTFTNASEGSDAEKVSHAAGSSDGQNASHAAGSSDGQNASPTLKEVIRAIGAPTLTDDKQPTIDETTGDIGKKQIALSIIYDGFLAKLSQTMREYGVGPELRDKIQRDLREFCDNTANNPMRGELKKIELPELDRAIIAIGDEREKEVIKHLFKVVFAVLDIPNQLPGDVSIPQQLNPNLSYPDNHLYAKWLRGLEGTFNIKQLKQLDKDIHEIIFNKDTNSRSKIVYTLLHTLLPQLDQSLTPEKITDSCLLEMFDFLNPFTLKGSATNEALERLEYVKAFLYARHKKGLYEITLRALEGMKEKGIIPADSVDRMIEQLKSLVNKK